jgi:hypothetical protein
MGERDLVLAVTLSVRVSHPEFTQHEDFQSGDGDELGHLSSRDDLTSRFSKSNFRLVSFVYAQGEGAWIWSVRKRANQVSDFPVKKLCNAR